MASSACRPAPYTVTRERTAALLQREPIHEQLPYRCPWGAEIRELPILCHSCSQPIDPSWVRGLIKRPIPRLVEVEAAAVCHPCRRMAAITVRAYQDGRVVIGSGGRWADATERRQQPPVAKAAKKLMDHTRRIFGRRSG